MSSEWRESFLDHQVKVLSHPEARAAMRALKAVWGLGEPHAPDVDAATQTSDWVGIWKRVREPDGRTSFVRAPERASDWGLWADVHRIPDKSRKRRILLLGESVARGYFFDPGFTVAQALQTIVDGVIGRHQIEVIDLASAGLRMGGLLSLVRQTPALRPDAVVIFGGNNWRNGSSAGLSGARRCARAGAVLDGGIAALKTQCEEELREDVRQALERIRAVYAPLNVPVVLVVPEFNLGDWREWEAVPGWLPNDRNAEWNALMARAQAALDEGAYEASERLAAAALEMDQRTCPRSLYLLADVKRRSGGSPEERRRLLEQARDSSVWDPSPLLSPRTLTVVQDTLRRSAGRLGMRLVDLPRAFDTHVPDGLPDRRMFLDYCHLTKDGIQIATVAMAEALLPLLGKRGVTRDALMAVPLNVRRAVEGFAHFGAAIHNAHWGQERSLVEHHCAQAMRLHGQVAEIMEDYVELTARRAPTWMCAALDRMSGRDDVALVRYIVSMLPMQPKLVDRDLLESVTALLGADAQRRLETLWCEEYGGEQVRTALDQPCFAIRSLNQREAFSLTHAPAEWPHFLRAYSRSSSFSFVEERARPIELCLTARLPRECTTDGELVVAVNGAAVQTCSVGACWQTWRVTVPPEHVRRGVNELTLQWPEPGWESSKGLSRAVESIEAAATPELFPAFGEVHSLWARNC